MESITIVCDNNTKSTIIGIIGNNHMDILDRITFCENVQDISDSSCILIGGGDAEGIIKVLNDKLLDRGVRFNQEPFIITKVNTYTDYSDIPKKGKNSWKADYKYHK